MRALCYSDYFAISIIQQQEYNIFTVRGSQFTICLQCQLFILQLYSDVEVACVMELTQNICCIYCCVFTTKWG